MTESNQTITNAKFEAIRADIDSLCHTIRFSGSNGNIGQFHAALTAIFKKHGVNESTWWEHVREACSAWVKAEPARLAAFAKEYPHFRAGGLPMT